MSRLLILVAFVIGMAACGSSSSPGVCGEQAASCGGPAECCSNLCVDGSCSGGLGCAGSGESCTLGPECCSGECDARICIAADCQGLGGECDDAGECCTGRCASGFCADDAGFCDDVGIDCSNGASCCSGRCEPVEGSGDVFCLGICFADGQACTRAQDCCGLGCNDGVCGGEICSREGENCDEDANCCSNRCADDGRCEIDRESGCRPSGEDCTSGGPTECCGVCDDDLDRCVPGADTCRSQGVDCDDDNECCSGNCTDGTCRESECVDTGGDCASDFECCSSQCEGTCQPPENCEPLGLMCESDQDCCSGFCLGGFCDQIVVQ